MILKGKKVVVTGGAGFIGSHVVDQLMKRENEVVVVDNFATGSRQNLTAHSNHPRLKVLDSDVRDLESLKKAFSGADLVIHMATHCVRLSLTEPLVNHEVNASGTLNALMAAKECRVGRFVYCSSSEVYGDVAAARLAQEGGALSELSPLLPTTVYGASKLVGEHYTLAYHQSYGLQAMVVRPFNAFGPRSHITGPYGEVIPRFATLMKAGMQPVIFGDGLQTRDFTYVEDIANGILVSAEQDKLLGDSINLAFGHEVSVRKIAEVLADLLGFKLQAKYVSDRPGDIRRLGANNAKARELIGWKPTSFKDGLARYLQWMDSQGFDFKSMARELTDQNWLEPSKRN